MSKPILFHESIHCPECGETRGRAIDSRAIYLGRKIRRRRECARGHRFTTYEQETATPRPPLPWTPDYQI